MPRTYEEIISYPEQMAGQRVGWVRVTPAETQTPVDDPPFEFRIVSATVGDDGARFGLTTLENPDGEKSLPIPSQEGFIGVVAVSGALPQGDYDPEYESGFQYQSGSNKTLTATSPEYLLLRGLGGNTNLIGRTDWATSKNDLLERIKSQLSGVDLLQRYPQVYYWLNGIVGRFDRLMDSSFNDLKIDDLLIADPEMKNATKDQKDLASTIARSLDRARLTDMNMLEDLTVFGATPASEIPRLFAHRRTEVAGLEQTVQDNLAGLAVRRLIYLPPGYRPSGRTWPYMDPTENDPTKAYGRELRTLEQGSAWMAINELQREVSELTNRRRFTQDGIERLGQLARLETTL